MRAATIKSSIAAAVIAMVGIAPSVARAGAQVDTKSLTDVLVAKGVLTKDEAKAVSKNNTDKVSLGATFFINAKSSTTDTYGVNSTNLTTAKTQGAAVDRAYLTGKYIINDTWKARVTTDIQYENNLTSKKTNVFLKYAYLQGDFMPELSVRAGVIHTSWIDHEEHLWGHRYVTKTMVDDLGITDSADAGIGIVGKTLGGMVNYQLVGVNGGGYGNVAATNGDTSYLLGCSQKDNPIKGMTIDFGYREGYRGQKGFSNGATTYTGITGGKQHLMQAMITYGSGHDYRLGVNYVNDKDKAKNALKTDGYALWGYYNFVDTSAGTLGIFARYQHAKITPYNNVGSLVSGITDETKQHNAIGLELKPAKGMAWSLVYDQVDTKNVVSGAGTAAATTTTDSNTRNKTFGLYGMLDF